MCSLLPLGPQCPRFVRQPPQSPLSGGLQIPSLPPVIPDIFNRESRVFAFSFVREEKDTGFRVKPGMTDCEVVDSFHTNEARRPAQRVSVSSTSGEVAAINSPR